MERLSRDAVDLKVDDSRHWRLDGAAVGALDGLIDVDLGWTPSTNTLSLRRLGLAVGEAQDVTAPWVRLPDLDVQPLKQRYTRLAELRYRYESSTGFTAELEVDELGLVTRYEGGWERVAAAP